jgi:hypothetical protein
MNSFGSGLAPFPDMTLGSSVLVETSFYASVSEGQEVNDPRFVIDLEDINALRERLAGAPLYFRQESQRKADTRRRRVELILQLDEAKREYKKAYGALFSAAKAAAIAEGGKGTDKDAEARVDNDPSIEPLRLKVVDLQKQIDLKQIDVEESAESLEGLKLVHRSLVSLLGDTKDERICS